MRIPLARDGLREIVMVTVVVGGAFLASAWAAWAISSWFGVLSVPLLAVWVLGVAFFRDPDRPIPTGPGLMVAPADGRVTEITALGSYEGIEGPATRIGIFLSVFDVHINRSPCAGRVLRTDYRPGEFLDARHPECGTRNESMTVWLEPDAPTAGPIVVRQIAGLIARRIICRVKADDRLERGERFGLIKFGSRTELIVPASAELEAAVRVGDTVRGGRTVLMRPRATAETLPRVTPQRQEVLQP